MFYWKHRSKIPKVPEILTCRSVFSLCRKLVRHYPVDGWLHVMTVFIKHRTASTTCWDDELTDTLLRNMIMDITTRIQQEDPTCG